MQNKTKSYKNIVVKKNSTNFKYIIRNPLVMIVPFINLSIYGNLKH